MVQTPIQSPIQSEDQRLTLEQFLALPETKPASEYIDGKISQKPMPQGEHSTLQGDLVSFVNGVLKPGKVGRAYPELRCTFGGRSTIPDMSVFRWERIPRQADGWGANRFELATDWVIEILSLEQRQTKVVRNILHCLEHGAEMGWLLEPEQSWIFVYGAGQSVHVFEEAEMVLPVPGFAGAVELTVGEVFGWLKG